MPFWRSCKAAPWHGWQCCMEIGTKVIRNILWMGRFQIFYYVLRWMTLHQAKCACGYKKANYVAESVVLLALCQTQSILNTTSMGDHNRGIVFSIDVTEESNRLGRLNNHSKTEPSPLLQLQAQKSLTILRVCQIHHWFLNDIQVTLFDHELIWRIIWQYYLWTKQWKSTLHLNWTIFFATYLHLLQSWASTSDSHHTVQWLTVTVSFISNHPLFTHIVHMWLTVTVSFII